MASSSNKKDGKLNNFIVQGGILAIAGVLVRMLGLVKRIPLTYIIGDVGNSYYSAAFEIYNIVLTISSYGIPLSVSKLVAAKVSRGQYKNARKIFICTLILAVFVGLISSSLVYIFAENLSKMMNEPMSYMALRSLAPTLFFVAIMGVFRGYFQGTGTMVPTACSQLLEQIVLIAVSLTSAYFMSIKGEKVGALLNNPNYKNAYGAAGATRGCWVGALASLLFLAFLYFNYRKKNRKKFLNDTASKDESTFQVYKSLILTIVPVVISSTVNNISNFLDQYIHNRIMVEKGLEEIKSINWGIYSGKYLVLINVPVAMANAMGASSVPTISGLMRRKEYEEAKDKIGRIIRVTMTVAIPCAMGVFMLAPELMYLLFSTTSETGPNLLRIGSLGIVFFSLSVLTNGIQQGMSKLSKPIIHALIALCVHVPLLVCLLKFTDWNIYAVAFSNNIFGLIIVLLNIRTISLSLHYRQEVKKTFLTPLLCSAIMGGILFLINKVFTLGGYSRILILLEILIGAVVYLLAMVLCKGITRDELNAIPGGGKLYAVFCKLHLM